MNRITHDINGVQFVPVNRDTFSLQAQFSTDLGDWQNDFTVGNNVILPEEGYVELLRHLNQTGIQQMPRYNIGIDGKNNEFFVDLYSNIRIDFSKADVSIKNFVSKDNLKTSIDSLTFEYLKRSGKITDADMIQVPFVVVQDDIGAKILSITMMIFVLTKEIIDRSEKLTTRIGDLVAAVTLNIGVPPSYPLGALIRYSILIAIDIATLVLLTLALNALIKQAIELLQPPVRYMKAMTVDRLLTIALAHLNCKYSSSLKSVFSRLAVLPVPIDYQKKKFFELLLNQDDRILNRGYPTSSDTVPTAGILISEICKMFNIRPRIDNHTLILEPRQTLVNNPIVTLDHNFNDQETKENVLEIDTSGLWNTKIISYQNDATDKLLFDNPRGLRCEYKSTVNGAPLDELTIIKGFKDIRINFALGTIKEQTKLDNFIEKLAKVADKLLGTSFVSKANKRKGVLAISQDQFIITKLLYQVGGKQTSDYVSQIGANALYKNYHTIDDSKNSLYRIYNEMPIRMNNAQFQNTIKNNLVLLEGLPVEILAVDYLPEMAEAKGTYRVRELEWAKHIKSELVYAE